MADINYSVTRFMNNIFKRYLDISSNAASIVLYPEY